MSEPTPGAEIVAIPTQKDGRRQPRHQPNYQPRHRGEPARPSAPEATTAAAGAAAAPPTGPDAVERVYATPIWVRPTLSSDRVVPQQGAPAHDDLRTTPSGAFVRPADLLRHGKWTTPRNGRSAVALLFVASCVAAIAKGAGLVSTQTTSGLAVALACLLAASGLYAVLVALRPTVVELDEVWLTVRNHGRVDLFDLTNPFQELALSGKPGSARWRLILGCPDRHRVELTGRMVDSRRLDAVVRYAQQYADRDRSARVDRFQR